LTNNYDSINKPNELTQNPYKGSVDLNTVVVYEKGKGVKKQPKHVLLSAEIELKMIQHHQRISYISSRKDSNF
jgi:hypothetical protein